MECNSLEVLLEILKMFQGLNQRNLTLELQYQGNTGRLIEREKEIERLNLRIQKMIKDGNTSNNNWMGRLNKMENIKVITTDKIIDADTKEELTKLVNDYKRTEGKTKKDLNVIYFVDNKNLYEKGFKKYVAFMTVFKEYENEI